MTFRRFFKGNPLNHPPIPSDYDATTSSRPHDHIYTGDEPGPQPHGPLDPRKETPRQMQIPRPIGQGCNSCKHNSQCVALHFKRNFGNVTNEHHGEGRLSLDSRAGISCESWNIPLEPLTDEDFNRDGLGMGNPFEQGMPDGLYNPRAYTGQYGQGRLPIPRPGNPTNFA